jgi:hypothetical protein
VVTETTLQRTLSAEVFGRAYGLALPASLAGIVAGTLIAPLLVSLAGLAWALIACGGVTVGYGVLVTAPRARHGRARHLWAPNGQASVPVPTADQGALAGAPTG